MRFVPNASLKGGENRVGEWKEHNEKDEAQVGRVYEPPKLVRVTLRPEETVLGHCKTSSSSGPGPSACMFCGILGS